eukprot:TRINITY_DN4678_c1_g3_i3.p1 TRINITY_DN4678_c1_g3~~TRINITY_DN4678_c1_g3_i3.p1  ORF type:complete len:283 (+),score=101.66 TRINITY_DN4678_c1_g3_i3:98-850(+)
MGDLLVYAVLSSGDRHLIELACEAEVCDLRNEVAVLSGTEAMIIGLMFDGEELANDNEMLADVGMFSECEVVAFQRSLDVLQSGRWEEMHADYQLDGERRLLLTSPCILSFNARWSEPIQLSDEHATIVLSLNLHSMKAMDHRHMVGLIPRNKFTTTGYLDSMEHECIAYEVNGNLIAGQQVIPTLCVYATGVVPVEMRIHCQSRCVTVVINGTCVLDEQPIRYWPTEPLYPFVTLNTQGEYVEPRLCCP